MYHQAQTASSLAVTMQFGIAQFYSTDDGLRDGSRKPAKRSKKKAVSNELRALSLNSRCAADPDTSGQAM